MSLLKEKRNNRKKATAEDFTPAWLIKDMLKKLSYYSKESFTDSTITFLDPACGNGNILLEILRTKLDNGHDPAQALSTIFGCDIMVDNIKECRLRLLKLLQQKGVKLTIEHLQITRRNIVVTPLRKYPNGSLDYLDLDETETFNYRTSNPKAKTALEEIIKKKLLDTVSTGDEAMSDMFDD